MKKALVASSAAAIAFLLPVVASAAQNVNDISGVGSFIINTINNVLVPVLFAVAFIVFLWGAFKTFILGAQSEETKEQGKNLMLYGLIGFFVMVSLWGLVNILTNSVGLDNQGPSEVPHTGVDVGG